MSRRVSNRPTTLLLKMTPGVKQEAAALGKKIRTVNRRTTPGGLGAGDVLVIRDESARTADVIALRPPRSGQRRSKRQRLDLTRSQDRQRFTDGLGLDRKTARAVEQILARAGDDTRDELAHLTRVLRWAEDGRVTLERLVISGHASGAGVRGNRPGEPAPNGELAFSDVAQLVRLFPRAARQVKHLMIAACYGAHPNPAATSPGHGVLESYREIFPGLEDVTAYGAKAPASTSAQALRHLGNWSRATRSGSPSRRRVFGRCASKEPDSAARPAAHRAYHGQVFTDRGPDRCPSG